MFMGEESERKAREEVQEEQSAFLDVESSDVKLEADPFAPRPGHQLSWRGVSFVVSQRGKEPALPILSNVAGSVKPHQLCCILGGSGAGKTTLLNVLAGRILSGGNRSVTKEVQLDGFPIDPSSIDVKNKIAFVAQTDSLLETATPREAIRFSARMRSAKDISDSDIEALTNRILSELRLEHVADTYNKHLSGGQRRRVSLGVELVVRPSIVFLDEVTSGLDSSNADQVIEVCKRVAESGAAVVMVAHQPSSKAVEMFDQLIIMHEGRCLCQGTLQGLPNFLEKRGYAIPENYNPADWIIQISQNNSTETLQEAGFFSKFSPSGDVYSESREFKTTPSFRRLSVFDSLGESERISVWKEFQVLFKRNWLKFFRDRVTIIRLIVIVTAAILLGIFYPGIGQASLETTESFRSHLGALFFLTMTLLYVVVLALLDIKEQVPLFVREYTSSHYRMFSYALVTTTFELINVLAEGLIFTVITYFSLGLQSRYWFFFLATIVFAKVCSALALFVASLVKDPRNALELAPLLTMPQVLVSGFIVAPALLPKWLQWTPWLSPYTYLLRLMVSEEFSACRDFTPEELNRVKCATSFMHVVSTMPPGVGMDPLYDSETTLTAAQTGKYTGKTSVTEYTSFFTRYTDPHSALWDVCILGNTNFATVNEASDGFCDVTIANVEQARLNIDAIDADLVDTPWLQYAFGQRTTFKYTPDLQSITFMDHRVFYPEAMIAAVVDSSDQAKLTDYICGTMQDSCPDTFAHNGFSTMADCVATLSTLPQATANSHGLPTLLGNSTTCRNLHATMVNRGGLNHCPHISFIPMEDENGKVKCSPEADFNMHPSDLFDASDFNLIDRAAMSFGLDEVEQTRMKMRKEETRECPSTRFDENAMIGSQKVPRNFGCSLFMSQQFATGEWNPIYWSILLGFFVVFRVTAFGLMYRKASRSVVS